MRASLAYRFFAFAYAFVSIHVARIYIHVSLFTYCTIYLFIHPKATVKRFCESSLLRTNHSTLQILCVSPRWTLFPQSQTPTFPRSHTHTPRPEGGAELCDTLSFSRASLHTRVSCLESVSSGLAHKRQVTAQSSQLSQLSRESQTVTGPRRGGAPARTRAQTSPHLRRGHVRLVRSCGES